MTLEIKAPEHVAWRGNASLFGDAGRYVRSDALRMLQQAGLSLPIPAEPTSKILTLDEEGFRFDLSDDEFRKKLENEESVWFCTWRGFGVDLLTQLRWFDSSWEEHHVIGHLGPDAEGVARCLHSRFLSAVDRGERGMLVLDWQGVVEGFAWAELWGGGETYRGPPPDLLACPVEMGERFQPSGSTTAIAVGSSHVAYLRVGSS
jgi:hypothetical protein